MIFFFHAHSPKLSPHNPEGFELKELQRRTFEAVCHRARDSDRGVWGAIGYYVLELSIVSTSLHT